MSKQKVWIEKMPEYCASVLSAVKRVNLLLED